MSGAVIPDATVTVVALDDTLKSVTIAPVKTAANGLATFEGLTPGRHGFHIHEKGDCSSPDFNSAGGHFNPAAMPHGSPTDPQHHAGDFGNLEANQDGIARYERVFNWLSFKGTNSIIGRAVIVHAKADDLKTQPTGNAGGRQACGVISQTR